MTQSYPSIELSRANIVAPSGRTLFEDLNLSLTREHVALIGRNGVGKSVLLTSLAQGTAKLRGTVHFVPQLLSYDRSDRGSSHGELRKRKLLEAQRSGADILLLDEPTEDLDDAALSWLRGWLKEWHGCLIVASHDRRILQDFEHFFVASESGCRGFSGTLEALDEELERDHRESQTRYVRSLNRLVDQEEHSLHVARRKARKKQYGRCRELDRGTPRIRLNAKRGDAQASHGKLARIREARISAAREWTKSMRRALGVRLDLHLPIPSLPPYDGKNLLTLRGLSSCASGVRLFAPVDLELGRERLAVVGPNGAGKTTLLEMIVGAREPSEGACIRDLRKIGSIAQGGTDWMSQETLVSYLSVHGDASPGPSAQSAEAIAARLVAHKFPLALAQRPMDSLSPGERVRAALLCLFARAPAVELLVLDEPTCGLDLVGQRALVEALSCWPGGLVVASHDRDFLAAIGCEKTIALAARSE